MRERVIFLRNAGGLSRNIYIVGKTDYSNEPRFVVGGLIGVGTAEGLSKHSQSAARAAINA